MFRQSTKIITEKTMGNFIDLRCDFVFLYCMSDQTLLKSFLNAILHKPHH